ncbi:MAG: hypothetical protein M0R80_08280 [Proteobacteria bacterium]|jgi:hypothetical protein|nr:hypothetical protein [Pseudomonadota bacterium]
MAGKLNYFVWLLPWTETVGLVVALNKLVDNLAVLGERAYGWGTSMKPHSKALLVPHGWHFDAQPGDVCYIPSIPPITPDNSVFIYPEPMQPLWGGCPPNGAKYFVRWFVYHNINVSLCETDIVFNWSDDYEINIDGGNRKPLGSLSSVDLSGDVFYDKGLKREGECMIVRKGWYKSLDKHCQNAICIDGYQDNQILCQIFNTTKKFICYDHYSCLPVQAAMCGCVPIVVLPVDGVVSPEHRTAKTTHMAYKKPEMYKYGVALGTSEKEIEWAKKTMHLVKGHMKALEEESVVQTKEFVKICEDIVLNK